MGGYSSGPFESLNLGHHVGDDLDVVAANRSVLASALPERTEIQWLDQVHGTAAVRATVTDGYPEADACWTRQSGLACAVLSADCLPVLLCNLSGTVVGAVHAGWRGLLNGVLESAVNAMGENPNTMLAWMGPAIGPAAFEVGPEVRSGFEHDTPGLFHDELASCFTASPQRSTHYMADLYSLAKLRLRRLGVVRVYGGGLCTYTDTDRFFSYRRQGQCGRLGSLICIKPD